MNIYLIEQKENSGWDTYSAAVVIAESADDARKIHPGEGDPEYDGMVDIRGDNFVWTTPEHVTATFLGRLDIPAPQGKVLCCSYHAS